MLCRQRRRRALIRGRCGVIEDDTEDLHIKEASYVHRITFNIAYAKRILHYRLSIFQIIISVFHVAFI